ncbi:hypothetical protein [Formosa sp. A9]|uniref:hypothetical protein n=1 Tax=Formosa sp. A9 TaxID=3442641 RepID=UPI003EC113C6
MPANKKYLSQSSWFKFGKLTAAILGSLLASVAIHAALATWLDRSVVLATAVYSGFIVWVGFMLVTYWFPKVWQAWSFLIGIVALCAIVILLAK